MYESGVVTILNQLFDYLCGLASGLYSGRTWKAPMRDDARCEWSELLRRSSQEIEILATTPVSIPNIQVYRSKDHTTPTSSDQIVAKLFDQNFLTSLELCVRDGPQEILLQRCAHTSQTRPITFKTSRSNNIFSCSHETVTKFIKQSFAARCSSPCLEAIPQQHTVPNPPP